MKREVRSLKCPASLSPGEGGSRIPHPASRRFRAFTLIELLVVIAIMGLLAAIAMPAVNKLKPNVIAAATQKLLADVGRARQLAIAHHTIVYMVFVPPGYWNDPAFNQLTGPDLVAAQRLTDKQMVGYNFVTLRSIGDQPGQRTVRYLDAWRTLPEGAFIPLQMFNPNPQASSQLYFYTNSVNGPGLALFPPPGQPVPPFTYTTGIPFPTETATRGGLDSQGVPYWTHVPFIAFNHLGQLVDATGTPLHQHVFIPLSQGSVMVARNQDKTPTAPMPGGPTVSSAVAVEKPVGNTTNAFNVINIDPLTGRARVERQEVL